MGLSVIALSAGARRFALSVASTRGWWTTVSLIVTAVALNVVWEARYGSHVAVDSGQLHAGIVAGFHGWWRALPELVGKFGYINVKLSPVLPLSWLVLICLVLAAGARGSRRDRIVLVALVVTLVVLPPVFYALFTRPTGFGLQGRQLLPAAVALPLVAGEVCYLARERLGATMIRLLSWLVLPAVGVVQAAAWYTNAKRFAVGASGSTWFLPSASWSPPLGWGIWLAVVLLAVLCFVTASGLVAAGQASPPAEHPLRPSPDGSRRIAAST
jgi:hypothetical protein